MTDAPQSDLGSTVAPTRWAIAIGGTGDERKVGLNDLAASYWYGVYAWWRRAGLEAASAATATVASFTRWLGDFPPGASDSGAARMREWLPARLAELAEQGVELEGPGALAIDAGWAERRYEREPPGEPDSIFQRAWALTLLEFTVSSLQGEYAARGEDALFAELLSFASFESGDEDRYAAAGERIGRSSGAMRKAVFEFRTRQRELLRDIAIDTLRDPADIDSELTTLLCAIDAPGTDTTPMPSGIGGLRPEDALVRAMQSVRMTGVNQGHWQAPSDVEVARLFPQYEILGLIGRGGMGAVYKARQRELDRVVAIKLLPLEISVDRDFADRFRREARAMAKLHHPHIITVFNFGSTSEGHLFFVMEFVEGANLQEIIRKAGMEPAEALAVVAQVCTALAYAHEKGIVHRDIKPANVMVDLAGQTKVADFGLARLNGGAEDPGYTVPGAVLGTPDYMAPEQKHGTKIDHRADIYSVGVMLYEMLCRETPQGAFQPPSQRIGCDARIDTIVLKAMHQAPDRRYQSTQEMRTAVASALTPATTTPRRRFGPSPPLPKIEPARSGLPLGRIALVIVVALTGFIVYENAKSPREIAGESESTDLSPPVVATPSKTEEAKPVPSETTGSPAPKIENSQVVAAPAVPPPTPAAPKSATAKWIAEQEPQWDAAYAAEVSGPFESGMAALNKQYLTSLETQFAASSKAAKLDDAVAFRAERDRLASGSEVPEQDEAATPASLKTLRASYRTSFTKLNAERLARAKTVHARYDTILQQSQTALTQKHRFDEALEMKAKREALTSAWLTPPAGAPVPTPAVSDAESQALAALVESSVQNPGETLLAMRVAALQVWFGRNADYAATCDRMLKWAAGTSDFVTAERVAKLVSFSPIADARVREAALTLGRRGVELGQNDNDLPFFRLSLGMAEYRNGQYAAAEEALIGVFELAPRVGGGNSARITCTSGYFQAMCAFKQGKVAVARELFSAAEARMTPLPPDGKNVLNSQIDDLISWLAYKEAKALLQIGAAARADPQASRLPEPKIDPTGWEDLLAKLTPAIVEQTGQGWRLENGKLFSSKTRFARLPLSDSYAGTSYRLRIKLQQVEVKDIFRVALPIGDRTVCFYLDGNPNEDFDTALACVDGGFGRGQRGAVPGKQIKDSALHELEVTVRLDGPIVKISSTLDSRPLHEWAGPIASLSMIGDWAAYPPGNLAIGSVADDWVVSEVKVKRLEEASIEPPKMGQTLGLVAKQPEITEPERTGARKVRIAANALMGGRVGAARAGQTLTVQYLEGKWADRLGLRGNRKTLISPDDSGTGGIHLAGLYAVVGGEQLFLAEIPTGTKEKPFQYRFDKNYARVILRISDPDLDDNPGEVTYSVRFSP